MSVDRIDMIQDVHTYIDLAAETNKIVFDNFEIIGASFEQYEITSRILHENQASFKL